MPASRRKTLPEYLKKMMKTRKLNLREAQRFCERHGFDISIGWLSVHKEEWMPDETLFKYEEGDKAFDTDLATRIMLFKGMKVKELSEKRHFARSKLIRFTKRTAEACAEFARECLIWKGKPIELQDYQLNMIRGWLGSKPTCYPIGRGGGKDFTLAVFLIWYCTCFPNTRVVVVCPATRQVKTFMNENFGLMMQTSSSLIDSIQKYIEEEFIFTNGSAVFTYGATSFIKGKHDINFIFANEAAEIPEHVFENVLLPMLGTSKEKGHFSILGVPGGQSGYFWKAFQDSSSDYNDNARFYKIHLPTEVNKYYSKEQLELNKQIMSSDVFLQEHMAQFLDIEGALFTQQIINEIKEDYETRFGIVDKKLSYFMGIDWGRVSAYTVCTILSYDKKNEVTRTEYIESSHRPFPEQIDWIVAADNIYNFKTIMAERMGIGIAPCDSLRKSLGSRKVKYFTPSAQSWFNVFTHLRDAAVNHKLIIPAGELKLITQLRLLGFKMSQSKITVRSEGKDDYAQSFGLAYWAIKKRGRAGVAGAI